MSSSSWSSSSASSIGYNSDSSRLSRSITASVKTVLGTSPRWTATERRLFGVQLDGCIEGILSYAWRRTAGRNDTLSSEEDDVLDSDGGGRTGILSESGDVRTAVIDTRATADDDSGWHPVSGGTSRGQDVDAVTQFMLGSCGSSVILPSLASQYGIQTIIPTRNQP
ncbi:hypothetical protein PBRA_009720 [Plasmodiophora brassicae]|uniref:Uncharacterized protein n=1 Tax=Plasmodiophora brassicae TaxID=37360 RepID=A0A0G4ILQ8_PLABS|nr:hypothetical protein PBRA_009720 [Plasmodiophora brassicae]